jgi:hypothetical protein
MHRVGALQKSLGRRLSTRRDPEMAAFEKGVKEVEAWWAGSRWEGINRGYSASDVVNLRGSVNQKYPSSKAADKAFSLFRDLQSAKKCTTTFGALDTVQVTQMAKYLPTVYVSGWQSSSTASSSNEPGPDLADYPVTALPSMLCQCSDSSADFALILFLARWTPCRTRWTNFFELNFSMTEFNDIHG